MAKNKRKLLTEYENITKRVLFRDAVLAALMCGRKYDVTPQNGDCWRESNVRTLVFRNKVRYQKRNVVKELNMEKIHLQIMLSDVD
jgi:uncharacterized protein YaiI (UPF0178 family)